MKYLPRVRASVFGSWWSYVTAGLCLAAMMAAMTATAARRELRGTVRVSGAWALYPMMVRWAEMFQKANPGVRIDVSAGGAGKGAADALGGLADIGMISRDIHPEEMKKGGFWVPVVKDAVLPTINSANPVARKLARTGVKRDVFVALWMEGKSLDWGAVAGQAGAKSPVNLYTRSDACGAAETWAKYLGGKQEDLKGVGVYGDPGLAEAVRKDPLGLGYNNLNYAYDAKRGKPLPGIMVLPLDINGNGKLDRSESFYANKQQVKAAIASGVYPSPPARNLNLLTKGKPSGVTQAFILWILRDGQKYVDEAGYIELPKGALAQAVKQVK